jgi:hypothetical protein
MAEYIKQLIGFILEQQRQQKNIFIMENVIMEEPLENNTEVIKII